MDHAGYPADMEVPSEITKGHGAVLLKDAVQSYSATLPGRPMDSISDIKPVVKDLRAALASIQDRCTPAS